MPITYHKSVPLFSYLGILQLVTALGAGVIGLLYFRYADGALFDFISRFLPDSSLLTWSIIGLMMLGVQVAGNFFGALFSFFKSETAPSIAMLLGGIEGLWMVFQFFILHMYNVLIPLFFLLALAQFIMGYLLSNTIKEVKKAMRDNVN